MSSWRCLPRGREEREKGSREERRVWEWGGRDRE